jgi:hypothetical protein
MHYIKHGRRKKKRAQGKVKSYILKQLYYNVTDENIIICEYFNLRTNAL